jgi:hypothetical protein
VLIYGRWDAVSPDSVAHNRDVLRVAAAECDENPVAVAVDLAVANFDVLPGLNEHARGIVRVRLCCRRVVSEGVGAVRTADFQVLDHDPLRRGTVGVRRTADLHDAANLVPEVEPRIGDGVRAFKNGPLSLGAKNTCYLQRAGGGGARAAQDDLLSVGIRLIVDEERVAPAEREQGGAHSLDTRVGLRGANVIVGRIHGRPGEERAQCERQPRAGGGPHDFRWRRVLSRSSLFRSELRAPKGEGGETREGFSGDAEISMKPKNISVSARAGERRSKEWERGEGGRRRGGEKMKMKMRRGPKKGREPQRRRSRTAHPSECHRFEGGARDRAGSSLRISPTRQISPMRYLPGQDAARRAVGFSPWRDESQDFLLTLLQGSCAEMFLCSFFPHT